MRPSMSGGRSAWIGYAALALALLVLGAQVRQTVLTVLSARGGAGGVGAAATDSGTPGWRSVAERDSLVDRARMGPRDPFRPAAVRAAVRAPGAAPAPERAPDPKLGSLLFDNVAPSVQLTIGTRRSGWLRTGEVFEGWRVVEISRVLVRVTDGTRTLVLAAS
jgi:hypothetical protein